MADTHETTQARDRLAEIERIYADEGYYGVHDLAPETRADALAALVEAQAQERDRFERLWELEAERAKKAEGEAWSQAQELVRAERRQKVYLDLNAGLREALTEARKDIIAAHYAGWDSERKALAEAAVDRIDAALAGLAGEGGPAAEEPDARLAELADSAELAVHALLGLLPLSGSWNSGYRVNERIDREVRALPEEWAEAAHAVADLHATLAEAAAGAGENT